MLLVDYHTHSNLSPDGFVSMAEMAAAAQQHGLDQWCITDHYDLLDFQGKWQPDLDWTPYREQFARAQEQVQNGPKLLFGIELGEATEDFSVAEKVIAKAPDLDFVIGSIHLLPGFAGGTDFYFSDYKMDPDLWKQHLDLYFPTVHRLAQWGQFDSLGHIVYPLRYMQTRDKQPVDISPYLDLLDEVYRLLIQKGVALELNTNRNKDWQLQLPLFARYRELGGELVTIGSDSHKTESVGAGCLDAAQALKSIGFRWLTCYEQRKPIQHAL